MVLRSRLLPTLTCVLASMLLAGCASASQASRRDPAIPQAKPRPQPAVGAALGDRVTRSPMTFRMPELTRKPGHVLRLRGTLPGELRMRLLLHYRPTVSGEACGERASLVGVEHFNPYQVTFERQIEARRGRFQTMVPIEPFSDACRWRLSTAVMVMSNVADENMQEIAQPLLMNMYEAPPEAAACDFDKPRHCDERRQRREFGWDERVRVLLPCKMGMYGDPPEKGLSCGLPLSSSSKMKHRVRRWTDTIEVAITYERSP